MDIHIVTETYPPEINGVAMTLGRIASGLTTLGHRITVIRPRQKAVDPQLELIPAPSGTPQEFLVRGCPLPRYAGLQFGLPCGRRLRRFWKNHPPDLVHLATEGPLGFTALRAARAMTIPCTSSFHTNFHRYGEHYGYAFLRNVAMAYFRYFHNRTRATFVPSDDVISELSSVGLKNLKILSRGVDTDLFDPGRRSAALRQSWGAGPTDPVVLYVGRIAQEKNLKLTMEAFSRFRVGAPNARLIIVGDGPDRERLQREHPEAVFVGMRRGVELAEHYASGDCFLFASKTETFGNVVTEAIASGLVVLAFDYAAARKHLHHERNGYLVPRDDDSGFLRLAQEIASSKNQWTEISQNARQTSLEISWKSVVEQFATDLLDLVTLG